LTTLYSPKKRNIMPTPMRAKAMAAEELAAEDLFIFFFIPVAVLLMGSL
jgi:hypothetical protein